MALNTVPSLRVEIRERVGYVTFARPEAANTIHLQFGKEFLAAAVRMESTPGVRAVLIAGEGRNFCFGGDLRAMFATEHDIQAYLSELTTDLHAGMAIFARLDAPVIAAVNGTAAGAGLGLVLAADIAIAARTAKFTAAYTGVGLTPDAGCTFLLPRAIGRKRALDMFLTNRVLSADQAFAWGLVSEIVEEADLMEKAGKIAAQIACGPVGAYGAVKRLMAESQPGFEAQLRRESDAIASRGATPEGREGITAFLEKRPPRYSSP
jgi:2-(1,2-epoxy-1,2-dihydrophenyl)acetyl-CoA isomerase